MVRHQSLASPPASSPAVAAAMKANKKRDTGPELIIRKLIHNLGYRYRLYAPDLPGKPDIVFRSRCKVIFVHGCFWHHHQDSDVHCAPTPGQIHTIGSPSCFETGSATSSISEKSRKSGGAA